ncbi:S-adenosyl-L-methionine-dependent methyltransferase [Agrocybe pediades]|nr:S-adenosyl-L-methionine-dependent methyltransferase [Agrocybe pediades]
MFPCDRAHADEGLKSSINLPEVLGDQDWTHSTSPSKTAFNKLTDYEGHPVGTHRGARFARGLIGCVVAFESRAVVHGYPWKDLGQNAVVCDLGSGVGTMSMELAKEHPNLQFVLHDTPQRLKQAKEEVWPAALPSALAENRVEFIPINFMTTPPAAGCDVYYMKNIMHAWSDDAPAAKVLSNVRRAMGPHSRVLLPPEPLLANYGSGRIRQYYLDMALMNLINGKARTLPGYVKLGESAGLEFVKVWDLGETSVIEYRLLGR